MTPPLSAAVPPHADDRDVLVVQIYGSKQWRVYDNVPIHMPYTSEQVGKGGLEVSEDGVLNGPLASLDDDGDEGDDGDGVTLRRGDVLYMPRGYVHEARTAGSGGSFHVTVAISTHDWTAAGIVGDLISRTLKGGGAGGGGGGGR